MATPRKPSVRKPAGVPVPAPTEFEQLLESDDLTDLLDAGPLEPWERDLLTPTAPEEAPVWDPSNAIPKVASRRVEKKPDLSFIPAPLPTDLVEMQFSWYDRAKQGFRSNVRATTAMQRIAMARDALDSLAGLTTPITRLDDPNLTVKQPDPHFGAVPKMPCMHQEHILSEPTAKRARSHREIGSSDTTSYSNFLRDMQYCVSNYYNRTERRKDSDVVVAHPGGWLRWDYHRGYWIVVDLLADLV